MEDQTERGILKTNTSSRLSWGSKAAPVVHQDETAGLLAFNRQIFSPQNRVTIPQLYEPRRRVPGHVGALVIAAVVLVLLGACGVISTPTATVPPPTATPTPIVFPTAPSGWSVHKNASFQISLPDTWQEISLDEAGLKSEIDAATTDNPYLATMLRSILESGQFKSFLFYATDKTSTDVINNVSIARTTITNATSVDQAAREYADALPRVLKGAKLVAIDTPLEINGQNAAEVDYDLPLVNAAGQVVTLRGVQYLVLPKSGSAYVITATGDAANEEKFVPLARQIGRSFAVAAP